MPMWTQGRRLCDDGGGGADAATAKGRLGHQKLAEA